MAINNWATHDEVGHYTEFSRVLSGLLYLRLEVRVSIIVQLWSFLK